MSLGIHELMSFSLVTGDYNLHGAEHDLLGCVGGGSLHKLMRSKSL